MRLSLNLLAVASFVFFGCASANFQLAEGDAAPAGDSGGMADAGGGRDDGAVPGDTGGNAPDGSSVEPCASALPSLACAGGNYEPQFDLVGAFDPGTASVARNVSHAISFVTQAPGRVEKIHLRFQRVDLGETAGAPGSISVSAFYAPCADVLVPLGKNQKAGADISGEFSFYFNPSVTGGGPHLPWLPAGARLVFVVETDSQRYRWNLQTMPPPSPNPRQFLMATRTGTGPWVESPRVAAAMSYIRLCGG